MCVCVCVCVHYFLPLLDKMIYKCFKTLCCETNLDTGIKG